MTISRLIHCGSHDPWLSVYKSAWLNPVIEEELLCKREIGNAHDTHAVAVRNIVDEDIEGSDTSQNSVRDFEIPDFSIGFQISNKI